MRSEVGIDHLTEDGGQLVVDTALELGRQVLPELVEVVGHGSSHASVRLRRSATAAGVSLVGILGRGAARVVAASGRRKVMYSR
jgi:hypothetical protein